MSDQEKVKNTILMLKSRIVEAEKGGMKLSETDTRQGLINPLFNVLGWDFSDFMSVKSEHRHKDYNEPVDYAFFSSKSNEQPILLLEAKALGTNLSNGKVVKQLCSYLGEMGVQWGVLSDGNKYIMYNSGAGASFEDQRFLTLQLKTVDTEDGLSGDEIAEKMLALLGREYLENEEIQSTYEEHMTNSQIDSAFNSLLSEPFDTLASAIRKEFKEDRVKANPNLRISTKRIIEYLQNISDEEGRIPVDLSSNESTSDDEVIHSVASVSKPNDCSSAKNELKEKRTKRITISDLMDDKICKEGDNWRLEYKGEVFWARVTGNGEMEVNGNTFSNPSKAGTSITQKPCAGWNWWHFKDKSGNWHQIEMLRKDYRDKHGIAAIKWRKKQEGQAA